MYKRKASLLFSLFIFGYSFCFSQIDSLEFLISKAKTDSAKFALYCKWSFAERKKNTDKAIEYAGKAIDLAKKDLDLKWEAKGYNLKGLAYFYSGEYDAAIENCENALRIARLDHDSIAISTAFNHLGNIYKGKSNFELAITYHKMCLAIREVIKDRDTTLIVQSFTNLGNSYAKNGQFELALDSYNKAIEFLKRKRSMELANIYNGIANVYSDQKKNDQSLEYYLKTYEIYKEYNNPNDLSVVLKNIGSVYLNLKNFKLAFDYYQQSLSLRITLGNKLLIADIKQALSSLFTHSGEFEKALPYSLEAYEIDKDLEMKNDIAIDAVDLARIYSQLDHRDKVSAYLNEAIELIKDQKGSSDKADLLKEIGSILYSINDTKRSAEYYAKAIDMLDSIHNLQTTEIVSKMQATFKVKDKEHELELRNEEISVQKLEIDKQQQKIIVLAIGSIIFLVLVFFIWRGYKKSKLANSKLEIAYQHIEEKNRDISDSINYAQKIQRSMLKIAPHFDKALGKDYFVLFYPRDVVSGDFYFIDGDKNGMLVAIADCTGHGVPGSLMSMLGIEKLKQVLKEDKTRKPSVILQQLNKAIKESMKGSQNESDMQDGMDIAICWLNLKDHEMHFAGANRPLIHTTIVNGKRELREIKGDKVGIGGYTSDEQQFTDHYIKPEKGDSFFFFTDGFADQFGGPEGKKFNSKQLKELLLNVSDKTAQEQKHLIEKTFLDWKKDKEQVDDVLILGLKDE